MKNAERYFLSCSMFTRTISNQKWNIAIIYGLELLNIHFPATTGLKNVDIGSWTINYFQISTGEIPQVYRKCSNELLISSSELHRTHQATYTGSNHCHSIRILLLRRKFPLASFFCELLLWWPPRGCFPNHSNLNLSKSRVNHYLSYISS